MKAIKLIIVFLFLALGLPANARTWEESGDNPLPKLITTVVDYYYECDTVIDGFAYRLDDEKLEATVTFFSSKQSNYYWTDKSDVYYGGEAYDGVTKVFSHNILGKQYAGEVIVPETVEFKGKTYTVKSIDTHAFDNCEDITNVVIPESVYYDYSYWQSNREAVYPSGYQNQEVIGVPYVYKKPSEINWYQPFKDEVAYYKDNWLEQINYLKPFPWLLKQPGSLIYQGNKLAMIPYFAIIDNEIYQCQKLENVEIKEGTTEVLDGAAMFLKTDNLKFPTTMKHIGKMAFTSSKLGMVDFGGLTKIDDEAFSYATFTSLDFGEITSVGNKAFYQAKFQFMDNSFSFGKIKYVGDSAFACAHFPFRHLRIPGDCAISKRGFAGVKRTEYSANRVPPGFSEYLSIDTLTLGNNVKAGEFAFDRIGALRRLNFNKSVILSDYAFNGTSVYDLKIPAGMTMGAAFTNCAMTKVTIGDNVTITGDHMLENCPKLKTLTIGNNVTIEGDEFCYFTPTDVYPQCMLEDITFGENVTLKGKRYFYYNTNLTTLKLGKNMRIIGAPFTSLWLQSIEVPEDDECNAVENGVLYTKDFSELICVPNCMPGDEAKHVVLNPALKRIRSNSIVTCTASSVDGKPYTWLTIPAGVEAIESDAIITYTDAYYRGCHISRMDSYILDPTGVAASDAWNGLGSGNRIILHIPRGSFMVYKKTEPWSQFQIVRDLEDDRVFAYDVNGDQVVNGSDITALYNMLLNEEFEEGECPAGADIDGNGGLNGADITALYNILLSDN